MPNQSMRRRRGSRNASLRASESIQSRDPPHPRLSRRRRRSAGTPASSSFSAHDAVEAGIGGTLSERVPVGGSLPPISRRNGGYESVISAAYTATRKTQRFIPSTK